jgi:hypothetical protein
MACEGCRLDEARGSLKWPKEHAWQWPGAATWSAMARREETRDVMATSFLRQGGTRVLGW